MVAIALVLPGAGISSALGEAAIATKPVPDAPTEGQSLVAVLPMMQDLVPQEMREQLPLPIGLSLGYFYLSEDLVATDLRLEVNGEKLPSDAVAFRKLDHATQIYLLRADAWVLPFLNVYGLAGYVDGAANHVEVDVSGASFPELRVPFAGTAFGVGSTLAGGYGPAFASLDFSYLAVDVNRLDSTVSAILVAPRAGWRTSLLGMPLVAYGGAMYLGIQGTQTGSIRILDIPVEFSLAVRSREPWNALLGAQLELSRHLTLAAEGGVGDRSQAVVSLRFAF